MFTLVAQLRQAWNPSRASVIYPDTFNCHLFQWLHVLSSVLMTRDYWKIEIVYISSFFRDAMSIMKSQLLVMETCTLHIFF